MLGQPLSMLLPEVIGFKLDGELREGVTATDLVLTVTQMLRKKGVVGKFVEFYGSGLNAMTVADRATLANMAPEYGATCGLFPIDSQTLTYLKTTGRKPSRLALVEAYAKAQGAFRTRLTPDPVFTDTLELKLGEVTASLAGPKRPQDRVVLSDAKAGFASAMESEFKQAQSIAERHKVEGTNYDLGHGDVVIAAITSCTNTSNPSVMMAAGLLARNAVAKGLTVKPWVKTSLAPGSQVVAGLSEGSRSAEAARQARLQHRRLRLHHLHRQFRAARARDFGDRRQAQSGRRRGPLRQPQLRGPGQSGRARQLPRVPAAGRRLCARRLDAGRSHPRADRRRQAGQGRSISPTSGPRPARSRNSSTRPSTPEDVQDQIRERVRRRRQLAQGQGSGRPHLRLGHRLDLCAGPALFRRADEGRRSRSPTSRTRASSRCSSNSITTDHISPAGSIKVASPAGQYLVEHQVRPVDFNQYGTRRGNHEVMMRGTFANIRIKNQMVKDGAGDVVEGGYTIMQPSGERLPIYDAAMRYQAEKVPLVVFAGREYGTGSSRDWAAKGTKLLGVRAVIAQSFERIHRSNLVGMGVLPLVFEEGTSWQTLGLKGDETVTIFGLGETLKPRQKLEAEIRRADDSVTLVPLTCRIDTLDELEYFKNGGILPYVLRQLAA